MITSKAKIFSNLNDFMIELLESNQINKKITLTSGGYGIIHQGHLACIHDSANLDPDSLMVVIVNGDDWLKRKKGFVVMPELERAEMISYVSGVDYVIIWDDGSPNVINAIKIIKPSYFTKGGDRNAPENIPEYSACQNVGCEVVFGMGGDKIQSSSNIIATIEDNFIKKNVLYKKTSVGVT
jgi:D-beta-D-heptose 7-phosphate kinase/D-beta-D-heptose 1-phosphate adenosyltransferase